MKAMVARLMCEVPERNLNLKVPLAVDVSVGSNWNNVKEHESDEFMKKLLFSPVIAAFVLSVGLIVSALILSRGATSPKLETPLQTPLEQTIRSQFVNQMTAQTGNSPVVDIAGNTRQLSEIVVDKIQISPKRNRADIDYHFAWQKTDICTYTQISLTQDEYGRFDSGDFSGMLDGNKHFRVIVQ